MDLDWEHEWAIDRASVRVAVRSIDAMMNMATHLLELDEREVIYEARNRLMDVLARQPSTGC
jgi:hypothetical protein